MEKPPGMCFPGWGKGAGLPLSQGQSPLPRKGTLEKTPGDLTDTHCPHLLPPHQASDRLNGDHAALAACVTQAVTMPRYCRTQKRVRICGWL